MRHRFNAILSRAAASVMFIAGLALNARADDAVKITHTKFISGGKSIAVDCFAPPEGKGKAAVIVLHGAGGMVFDAPEMRRVAERLAQSGDAAYLVHYFDRTGTLVGLDSNMQAHYAEWLGTVRDATEWVQAQREDGAPVGIFGYSLGAFLSVAAASDNPRVAAVVEQSGGVWNNKMDAIGQLPSILLVHGKKDERVPFEKYARPLLFLAKRQAYYWQARYYPNEGHGFSERALADLREHAAEFFEKHLRHAR